jgi:putative PIN family toxin of toxin-antitoxin system
MTPTSLSPPSGFPAAIVKLALHGRVRLYVSEDLLTEYRDVLHRSKFGFHPNDVKGLLSLIERQSKYIQPTEKVDAVTLDPNDNRLLECAVEGGVDYIVTGNTRHFPFKSFRGIPILTPSEFAKMYLEDLLSE